MADKLPKATHQGELKIGDIIIPCAVLEDGRRVLRERSIARTLGKKGAGSYWKKKKDQKGAVLPEYVSAKFLDEYIDDDLRINLLNPINYITLSDTEAQGMDAELLPEICDIWLKAREKGALSESQMYTAKQAEILVRGFAKIGIIALIDEATGYQEVRDRLALAEILDKYIRDEYRKWTQQFPPDFYKEMFRLKGWYYDEKCIKRPGVIGNYTNDYVYSRLAPGVLKKLREKNPRTEKGYRKLKHHQWLTDNVGIPELKEHLTGVIALMKASANWDMFKRLVNRAYTKYGDTIPLDLDTE